jgi:hypothetical protein
MRTFFLVGMVVLCASLSVPAIADMNLTVSGQACPYFAGQTFGSIPLAATGDSADYHLDIFDPDTMPPWIDITGFGGMIASITATGTWGHPTQSGPDGYSSYDPTHQEYTALGISAVLNTPLNTLLGVFLTNAAPVAGTAPSSLTFGDDMTNPLLQQTFVIGSSLADITIPGGATRLFFGLNDGYEWTNNIGDLNVTVTATPLPAALLLGIFGLGTAGWRLRRSGGR